jgi:hypothetical protein
VEYNGLVSYGADICAFADVAASTSPADITHPVNSFIACHSCKAPWYRSVVRSFVPATISLWIPAALGQDRGAFASNPGRNFQPAGPDYVRIRRRSGAAMPPGTFACLYDRKKFGMVGVRTVLLSQLTVQTRHGDCNESRAPTRQEIKGKVVPPGR